MNKTNPVRTPALILGLVLAGAAGSSVAGSYPEAHGVRVYPAYPGYNTPHNNVHNSLHSRPYNSPNNSIGLQYSSGGGVYFSFSSGNFYYPPAPHYRAPYGWPPGHQHHRPQHRSDHRGHGVDRVIILGRDAWPGQPRHHTHQHPQHRPPQHHNRGPHRDDAQRGDDRHDRDDRDDRDDRGRRGHDDDGRRG